MTLRNVRFGAVVAVLGGFTLMASSSAKSTQDLYQEKTVGDYLPKVTITNGRTTGAVPERENNGLTLVHFWAAYDADSRADQVVYDSFLAEHKDLDIAYQAISLDVDKDVYAQTLAFDGVDRSSNQLLADPEWRTKLIELCGLQKGLHAYLLDGAGKILSVDPKPEELEQFVRS